MREMVASLDDFLATYAELDDVVEEGAILSVIPNLAILKKFKRLERSLNPNRLSYDSGWQPMVAANWPDVVVARLNVVYIVVCEVIRRWGVQDICIGEDPYTSGTLDKPGWKVTPIRPFTITSDERAQLEKTLEILRSASYSAGLASPRSKTIDSAIKPTWNKGRMTLTFNGEPRRFREDATAVAEIFDWFEDQHWETVIKIKCYDIIRDIDHINDIVKRANSAALELGFTITRKGEELRWTAKPEESPKCPR
jgi:hypothetical protein